MGIFKYPYTDLHELNLDMILAMIKQLDQEMDDFVAANKITNAGAWDITRQYQAWTIVSDNNAGYISLRPVPVGIDIHNTEYWGLIADYNILITDLSNRISALESSDILQNQRLDNLETDPDDLYLFITDSYGDPVTLGTPAFWNYLGSYTGKDANLFKVSYIPGAGFSRTSKFEDQLTSLISTLTNAEKKKNVSVFFVGCINDINDLINTGNINATLTGMRHCADIIDNTFTKVKKKCVIPCGIGIGSGQTQVLNNYNDFIYYIKNSCAESGLAYVPYSEFILTNYSYINQLDGLHPVEAGCKAIARFITNIILSDEANYTILGNISGTKDAALGGGSFNLAQVRKNNGTAQIMTLNGLAILSFTTPPVLTGYFPKVTIGTFPNNTLVRGHQIDDRPSFTVPGYVNGEPLDVDFYFNTDNTIKVRLNKYYASVPLTEIRIPPTSTMALPEML